MEMSNITARIRDQISSFETKEQIEEIGEVSFIGDGIARVIGLTNVMAGELVEFENGAYGMAQNLEKNDVGVIIFGGYENIPKDYSLHFGGPAPEYEHEYEIWLYALDYIPNLKDGFWYNDLRRAMKGHVLEKTCLSGFYG